MLQLSCLQTVYSCFVPFDCSQYSLGESSNFLVVSVGDKITVDAGSFPGW